jgi:chromosome segregation protein
LAGLALACVPLASWAQTNERVSEFLRNTNNNSEWLERPELIGMARALVQVSDEALRPLVAQLLDGVAVVHDLDEARRCAALHPAYTFVTRDGDVVRPGGVVTGGVMEGPAVGALQKKREIADLQEQIDRLPPGSPAIGELWDRKKALLKRLDDMKR